MTHRAFARKYRPARFDDLVGQPHVSLTLSRAIENDRLAHAYLFVGGRGLGKTSTARILAKAVNCEKGPTPFPCGECSFCIEIAESRSVDTIEIDAASHGSVDDARSLIERARLSPASARKKIYIIDETHMLSTAAFNALLKLLEEPPDHNLFIFATTEGDKVPETVRSRCQRFDFRPISDEEIAGRIREVAEKEKISITDEAVRIIALYAEGGMRDAVSALDQVSSAAGSTIDERTVRDCLGLVPAERVEALKAALASQDLDGALGGIAEAVSEGRDLGELGRMLLDSFREDLLAEARGETVPIRGTRLIETMRILSDFIRGAYRRSDLRLAMELAAARIVRLRGETRDLEEALDKLTELESRLGGGENPPEGGGRKAVSKPLPEKKPPTSASEIIADLFGAEIIE